MVVLNVTVNNCTPVTIPLGMRGTYNTREVVFDLTNLVQTYGSGTAVLLLKRSQDSNAYPAVVSQDENTLTWIVAEADTYYYGSGECQLMWYTDEGLAKTIVYPTIVTRDIAQTTGDPPESYETWIEQLTELGAQTQQNAEDAQEASQAIQNMSVEANGVAYDQPASVEKTVDPDTGAVTLTFDIPAGTPGGGGGGAVDSVNGKTGTVVLTASDVGAKPESYEAPVSSVAGKTGAVVLDSGDISYDESATYQAGSVGAELSELTRHLSDKQDAPSTAGTAGQVLGLDSNLDPVWVNNGGGSGGAVTDVQINGTSILRDGVANIPNANGASPGVVWFGGNLGVTVQDGQVRLNPADSATIKAGTNDLRAFTVNKQHEAAFYGFAKAAGDSTQSASANTVGTYTEDAKSAIHEMLNGAVTVSGTTPTIVAKSGITYVCGEVATLDITLPASGIFEVQFVSGSTPTVLTATGVTWLNGFDPTALEANTTYEINILNGLGVAAWT